MKIFIVSFLIAAVVIVECSHTFMGTSVQKELVYQRTVKYSSKMFQKRVETVNITIPYNQLYGRYIQGVLAYDLTNSDASANVTAGGIGSSFVNLRMKSDKGKDLKYDVFIYA
ncbi:PREDICTED: uncharacterized protein LOC106104932 [Papilio polytes]|uniref:uncharacterized protein LOC106104932 n=1 Tax=Papilio polytes TaxID=76194 RepID=UPI00067619AE|nr:PREDICTED: uncharacterized protein LOC106104932 [Papilio polytes]